MFPCHRVIVLFLRDFRIMSAIEGVYEGIRTLITDHVSLIHDPAVQKYCLCALAEINQQLKPYVEKSKRSEASIVGEKPSFGRPETSSEQQQPLYVHQLRPAEIPGTVNVQSMAQSTQTVQSGQSAAVQSTPQPPSQTNTAQQSQTTAPGAVPQTKPSEINQKESVINNSGAAAIGAVGTQNSATATTTTTATVTNSGNKDTKATTATVTQTASLTVAMSANNANNNTNNANSKAKEPPRVEYKCHRCGEATHLRPVCLRYKLQLCRYFEEGRCNKARHLCSYAHGKADLRSDPLKIKCGNCGENHVDEMCPVVDDDDDDDDGGEGDENESGPFCNFCAKQGHWKVNCRKSIRAITVATIPTMEMRAVIWFVDNNGNDIVAPSFFCARPLTR